MFPINRELIGGAKELKNAHADPESADVAALIQRLRAMCQLRGLGDPYVYVEWRSYVSRPAPGDAALGIDINALKFLARVMGTREHEGF